MYFALEYIFYCRQKGEKQYKRSSQRIKVHNLLEAGKHTNHKQGYSWISKIDKIENNGKTSFVYLTRKE